MFLSFLKNLMCPYCGTDFEIEKTITQTSTEIINGIIKCTCTQYPVLKGILILNEDLLKENIIKLIKQEQIEKATTTCLWNDYYERIKIERTTSLTLPFPEQITHRLQYLLSILAEDTANRKFHKLYQKYSDNNITFFDLMGENLFGKYLKHRFSADSFWTLYPFIPILKKKNSKILDLSCGAGHGSFILSEYIKPNELCSTDKYFNLLYLARKYFTNKANYICLDFNKTLPFKNHTFSSILMSDALMLVQSRYSLIREIKRSLTQNGISIFLHVHNSLGENLEPIGTYEKSMTPSHWKELFRKNKMKTKIISEKKVLEDFLINDKINLKDETKEAELNNSNALIILSTKKDEIFDNHYNLSNTFLTAKNNVIINPIYSIKNKQNSIILSRPKLTIDTVGDFYPIAEKYLPKEIELEKNLFNNGSKLNHNNKNIEGLMKKFVIVNVPQKYN